MIIAKAPLRISFFGGGTDYPEYFNKYCGKVISTSFDKYIYATVRHLPRFFNYSNQIVYAKVEQTNNVQDIEHPSVREAMRYLDMHDLRIVYDADIPARSGVGSSSAFAVALLQAFYALKGKYVSKQKLSEEAIHLERTLCKENGGWQDQIASAFGGLNKITFKNNGFSVEPIIISKERKELLNKHLMLFFTGFSRFSSDLAKVQKACIEKNICHLKDMYNLAEEAEKLLISKVDISQFGKLLHESWKIKKGLTDKISNRNIDDLYDKALKCGAIGGKILGAGGGGFMLLFVPPERQAVLLKQFKDLIYVPFQFDSKGAEVLYYYPEEYFLPKEIK